jgi:hypothetical protein
MIYYSKGYIPSIKEFKSPNRYLSKSLNFPTLNKEYQNSNDKPISLYSKFTIKVQEDDHLEEDLQEQ